MGRPPVAAKQPLTWLMLWASRWCDAQSVREMEADGDAVRNVWLLRQPVLLLTANELFTTTAFNCSADIFIQGDSRRILPYHFTQSDV